jgi:hypothetical protein
MDHTSHPVTPMKLIFVAAGSGACRSSWNKQHAHRFAGRFGRAPVEINLRGGRVRYSPCFNPVTHTSAIHSRDPSPWLRAGESGAKRLEHRVFRLICAGARPCRADPRSRSRTTLCFKPKHHISLGEPPDKPLKHGLFHLKFRPNRWITPPSHQISA